MAVTKRNRAKSERGLTPSQLRAAESVRLIDYNRARVCYPLYTLKDVRSAK